MAEIWVIPSHRSNRLFWSLKSTISINMTLEQLRIFVAVAERLHMTRAADALGLSQSAASSAIAALETVHGVKLFDRVGRGLELSDAGRAFLPEARAVLARAEAAARTLDDVAGLSRGSISLGASQTVSSYWLPPRMARFAERYPGVALSMIAGNTAQIVKAVLDGRADLGFVEGDFSDPALRSETVASDRIGLYVAPGHPLAGRNVGIGELRSAAWVLRETGSGTRAHFEQQMALHGAAASELRIVLELPSNEAVLAAAMNAELVTSVSELAAEPLIATGRLKALPFALAARTFRLITHRERRRSRAAQAFVAEL
jgi:DNA-binding transcriptional LysR family regulator